MRACVCMCSYSVQVLNRYYVLYLCVYGYDALVFMCVSLWLQCTVFVCLSVDTMQHVSVCLWILCTVCLSVDTMHCVSVCLWILCTVLVCVCGYCALC